MSEEVLINITPRETRVAMLENGVLQEVVIERANHRGLTGNIYKGKVVRILPGMSAAFVDIGLERAGFLHVSDLVLANGGGHAQDIGLMLRDGQNLLVQVARDPLGAKGARLTTQISIPSRYLVFIPDMHTVGVSQRIAGDERTRLLTIVRQYTAIEAEAATQRMPNGYIIRTAAGGVGEESIQCDIDYLKQLWAGIQQTLADAAPGSLLYEEPPLVIRTIRDLVGSSVEKIRVDSREAYQQALVFAEKYTPELTRVLEHYPGERPIFDLYSVEEELAKALESRVELKSGGYLVIEQTEAMTTIDVNTGKYVGSRTQEETIFRTNLEAAQAIPRQLRLRNLGGIIIVDFIDMQDAEHQRLVIRALEKALERDHAKTYISEVSALGLVQMTRKRTRESLEHILCEPCPTCKGLGSVKTAETVCYEIFREILREARQFEAKQFLVLAAPNVVDRLVDEESETVTQLESFIRRPIKLQMERNYLQTQYDIVLL